MSTHDAEAHKAADSITFVAGCAECQLERRLIRKMADAWNRRVDTLEPGWNACPSCGFSLGAHPEMCGTCDEFING